jgi:hypothetical protein
MEIGSWVCYSKQMFYGNIVGKRSLYDIRYNGLRFNNIPEEELKLAQEKPAKVPMFELRSVVITKEDIKEKGKKGIILEIHQHPGLHSTMYFVGFGQASFGWFREEDLGPYIEQNTKQMIPDYVIAMNIVGMSIKLENTGFVFMQDGKEVPAKNTDIRYVADIFCEKTKSKWWYIKQEGEYSAFFIKKFDGFEVTTTSTNKDFKKCISKAIVEHNKTIEGKW